MLKVLSMPRLKFARAVGPRFPRLLALGVAPAVAFALALGPIRPAAAQDPEPAPTPAAPEEDPETSESLAEPTPEEPLEERTDIRPPGAGTTGAEAALLEAGRDGWVVSGELGSSVGQGSFVANQYARNAYVDWSVSLSPGYRLSDGTAFSARLSLTQELTDSDSTSTNHELLLSDLQLQAIRRLFEIPTVEIGVRASLRVYLPTSLASQYDGLYFGALASLGFTRTFGDFSVAFETGFRKNFHAYTSPTIDVEGLDETIILAREGGNERVDAFLISPGGNNVSYQFRNTLSLGWSPLPGWSFSASYLLANAFTYTSYDRDGLAGVHADAGRGQRDAYLATIDASWEAFEHVTFSAGILTQGSPRTADTSGFRFPFYDFESEAENLTTFYVTATGTLDETDL